MIFRVAFCCNQAGCFLFSETDHGLRLHCLRLHRGLLHQSRVCQTAQNYRLSVPSSLRGDGKRLKIDKIRNDAFTANSNKEGHVQMLPFLSNNPQPPFAQSSTLSPVADVFENICDAFLQDVENAYIATQC